MFQRELQPSRLKSTTDHGLLSSLSPSVPEKIDRYIGGPTNLTGRQTSGFHKTEVGDMIRARLFFAIVLQLSFNLDTTMMV
ncbi:hypothetical protein Mapa_001967 [Marchantia paleacea]|nr:hypothetical protein Mapa_001967 [Marchantia paleacea]